MSAGGFLPGLKVGYVQGNTKLLAEVAHKSFIAFRFRSPQVEVAMCGFTGISQGEEYTEQGYGVGTSAQGHHDAAVGSKKFMSGDVAGYFLLHGVMEVKT